MCLVTHFVDMGLGKMLKTLAPVWVMPKICQNSGEGKGETVSDVAESEGLVAPEVGLPGQDLLHLSVPHIKLCSRYWLSQLTIQT